MIPIRCFTCGKVVADKLEEYNRLVSNGENRGEVLTKLGLIRLCCRRMILSYVEIDLHMLKY
jgi:DNA-directed RNA polymerase subunit N (RpoN/RPB10)